MSISLFELKRIMPNAGKRAELFLDHLNAAMLEYDISISQERECAFLAQIAHESGELRYVREIASGEQYDNRADLGNTDPDAIAIATKHGSTPGRWWRGHGLIQITGYSNHLECGDALGLDLLNEPQLLEQPEHAAMSAAWFWKSRGMNELADKGRFQIITKRINGGLNGYADRIAYYRRAQQTLGDIA